MPSHPARRDRYSPEETPVELDPIQRALRDNEDWYRDLVEHSQDLLCVHNLQGDLLSVNPAPARVLGYSVEELLRIPMREMVAPEFRVDFDKYLRQIQQSGESRGLMVVLTRTGERRIWEYHNTLRTEGVASPIVRGIAHDVTEHRRSQKRLQEYERVVEGLDEMIVVVDRNYRYLIANHAYLKFRGHKREQVIGHQVEDVLGKKMFDAVVKPKLDECFQGKVVRCELRHEYPQLGVRDLFLSYFPLDGAAGIDRVVAILQDITELKRAEEKLREYEKVVEGLEEMIVVIDRDYRYLIANHAYLKYRGLEREQIVGHNVPDVVGKEAIDTELGFGEIIGQSKVLRDVLERVARVAATDATVLILGETGTGKELVARAIHNVSKRHSNSFIKVNCAAIPSGLLESELFGHEKGAFTGAVARKIGRMELADQGTLFLDEIGDIPMVLQPKLLRVLQDQEFERLGSIHTLKVNFRLIAATNRDFSQGVEDGQFRSDLYYRLNVFPVRVPPLRERREDIPLLVQHFVLKCAKRMNKAITSIPVKTMETLQQWDWPGNIRELENFVERSVILTHGSVLQSPLKELESAGEDAIGETLEAMDREHIIRTLQLSHGKLSGVNGAAERLGLNRTTLQSKLKRLGIDPERYR